MFIVGFLFGLIVGYLCSKFFHPSIRTGANPFTPENITTIVGVILGALILTIFKPGESGFAGYMFGVVIAFFAIPIINFIREQTEVNQERRQKELQEEIGIINSNWPHIESIIKKKLQSRLRPNEQGGLEAILWVHEMKEFGYSLDAKLYTMRFYAQTNINQGVELKSEMLENEEDLSEEVYYLYQSINQRDIAGAQAYSTKVALPSQISAVYQWGDDTFDPSFSINSPSGEFLGEFGLGISETLGSATPKQVAAFEIWLFDKNQTKTQTRVISSPFAFRDEAARKRLAAKGSLILAQKGSQIVLETASLRIMARVVDLSYGTGGPLPNESYFDRLQVEFIYRIKQ